MDARSARVVRALVAASVSTSVAAFSHVAGGGEAPGWVTLSLAAALASLVSMGFSSARLSLWRLTATVLLSQAAFHLLFSVTGSVSSVAVAHHHSDSAVPGVGALPGHHGAEMWFAHAVAAAVTIVALAHGERLLLGLLDLAGIRLASASGSSLPALPRSRQLTRYLAPAVQLSESVGVLRHRGPPLPV